MVPQHDVARHRVVEVGPAQDLDSARRMAQDVGPFLVGHPAGAVQQIERRRAAADVVEHRGAGDHRHPVHVPPPDRAGQFRGVEAAADGVVVGVHVLGQQLEELPERLLLGQQEARGRLRDAAHPLPESRRAEVGQGEFDHAARDAEQRPGPRADRQRVVDQDVVEFELQARRRRDFARNPLRLRHAVERAAARPAVGEDGRRLLRRDQDLADAVVEQPPLHVGRELERRVAVENRIRAAVPQEQIEPEHRRRLEAVQRNREERARGRGEAEAHGEGSGAGTVPAGSPPISAATPNP